MPLPFLTNVFENEQTLISLATMVKLIREGGRKITCVLPNESRSHHGVLEFRIFAGPPEEIRFEKTGLGSASSPAPCLITVEGESADLIRETCKHFTEGLQKSQHGNATIWCS